MPILRFLRRSLFAASILFGCVESTPVCGTDCDEGVGTRVESNTRSDAGEPALACDSIDERARQLLAAHQRCEVDADCTTGIVEGRCLSGFLCPPAVARDADLDALRRGAAALTAEYEACMNTTRRSCPIPRCIGPDHFRLVCDSATKLCAKKVMVHGDVTRTPDAGPASGAPLDGGSATTDAATTTDAKVSDGGATQAADASANDAAANDAATSADAASPVDTRFSCEVAADCAVKNVGNCCGYYPRCANVDAVFGPPDCSDGQGGVCGWPEIESCDCRANRCVSLQGGREI